MRLPLFWIAALFVQAQSFALHVETYQREAILPLLVTLNTWADRAFGHYPYLLSSSEEQIVCPSDLVFVNARDAMIALAKQEDKIVGIAAMISFDSPTLHTMYFHRFHIIDKCISLNIDPSKMLYVAYFLTDEECHNDLDIVDILYHCICNFALKLGKSQICFMEDITQHDPELYPTTIHHDKKTSQNLYLEQISIAKKRDTHTDVKPTQLKTNFSSCLGIKPSKTIEPWGEIITGYTSMGIEIQITWPTRTIHGSQEIAHTLEFFVKDLRSMIENQ